METAVSLNFKKIVSGFLVGTSLCGVVNQNGIVALQVLLK